MLYKEIIRDSNGKPIDTGAIVKHGNKRGIVLEDEFEGQYAVLENGTKLRVKDYCKKLSVVYCKRGVNHASRK
ncbi:hypothetical protein CS063_01385 [Sporanaerobium hydrogeniformans]|uniref:Uncharacterized protein n=1 Tax=Sporanaerobium hydrogeniformans TaxID=3072179 RepID=A0AC61DHV9_9FIRM|nr:hypothetical protein [Sporanaerobium hydrogeniformans]PHV72156.1 hypothetical protein CS063_01385 [Sporanaerobium hydrogeniformans]